MLLMGRKPEVSLLIIGELRIWWRIVVLNQAAEFFEYAFFSPENVTLQKWHL